MITSIILLLILALALWGIYMLTGKAVNGVPLAIVGIILILVWLGAAYYLFTTPTPLRRVAAVELAQPSI